MTDVFRDKDETNGKSSFDEFSEHVSDSLRYGLFQAPVNGFVQLVDHTTGSKNLPEVQFCNAPKQSDFGSAGWLGDLVGGTAATGIQLGVLHRFVGAGAAANAEKSATYGLRAAMPGIQKSFATGVVLGGLFTEVDDHEGNFLAKRVGAAGVSGLTFAGITAGSVYLKSRGSAFLANDIVANAAAGAPMGVLNADLHSLTSEGRFATNQERFQSGTNYALGGAFAGGVNILHEHAKSTSGIRGVRTLQDMKNLADTTISPDHPPLGAFEGNRFVAPNAEDLMRHGNPSEWHEKATLEIRRQVDKRNLTLEQKKIVVSEGATLAPGLEALNNRPNPKPIVTIYGSARLGENSFDGHRARYIAGLAAENGYDVMNGGAPHTTPTQGGIMGMASRGAFEANTNAIRVTIELPWEKADAPDKFSTLEISCRNFPGRKVILSQVDQVEPNGKVKYGAYAYETAGLGTLDEFYDLVTQMQTGKVPRRPVYVFGETGPALLEVAKLQLKLGTISPEDLNLFKIAKDPRDMFADLPKWHQEIRVHEAQQTLYREAGIKSPGRTPEPVIVEKLAKHYGMADAKPADVMDRFNGEVAKVASEPIYVRMNPLPTMTPPTDGAPAAAVPQ